MKTTTWHRAVALVTTLCFALTSCTSLQGVTLPSADRPNDLPRVQIGENVVAKTRDGKEHKFKVTAVEADALVGKNVRVKYADMTQLNVSRFNGARTGVLAAVLGGLVMLAVIFAAVDDAVDDCYYDDRYYCE